MERLHDRLLGFCLDISIAIDDFLWHIPKAYPALEAEYKRLELDKYLSVEARNTAFASLILNWGDCRESSPTGTV